MSSIQDKVREGYISLSKRTLELYEDLRADIITRSSEDTINLVQFQENLEKVKNSGVIRSIGESGKKNFNETMDLIGRTIHRNLKPTDFVTSFALASTSIRAYFGIPNFEELLKRGRINSVEPNADCTGIATMMAPNGNIQRILLVSFDPYRPVRSTISFVHELIHSLRPEDMEIEEILKEKKGINGYDRFLDAIKTDKTLKQKRTDIAIATHELNFYKITEVITKARETGVNLDQLEAYLRKNIPRMNFLTCYTEGDAYITQKDVIACSPDLKGYSITLKAYEIMALADALSGPFLKPKEKIYGVGIGLFEYLRNHPDQKESLKNSREFHLELTNTYF